MCTAVYITVQSVQYFDIEVCDHTILELYS